MPPSPPALVSRRTRACHAFALHRASPAELSHDASKFDLSWPAGIVRAKRSNRSHRALAPDDAAALPRRIIYTVQVPKTRIRASEVWGMGMPG